MKRLSFLLSMPIFKAIDSKKNGDFTGQNANYWMAQYYYGSWKMKENVSCFNMRAVLTFWPSLSRYCSDGVLFTVIWILLISDSHLLHSHQGSVFLTILASKVLSLLYLAMCRRPGINHQGAVAVTARVSWCEDVRQCPALGIQHGFFLFQQLKCT